MNLPLETSSPSPADRLPIAQALQRSHDAACDFLARHSGSRAEALLLALILLLGLWLRAFHLGLNSLWLDEMVYVRSAVGDGTLLSAFGPAAVDHPLGYLLLLRLVALISHADWWLRFPSLLASLAIILAVWALGRLVAGRAVGLVAAFLTAISSFQVDYAQEAHSYALFGALATTMLWSLYRVARQADASDPAGRSRQAAVRAWWPFVAAAGTSLYVHYYAALAVGLTLVVFPCFVLAAAQGAPAGREGKPQSLASLWRDPARRRLLKEMLAALGSVALLALPQALLGLGDSLRRAGQAMQRVGAGEAAPRFDLGLQLLGQTFLDFIAGINRWSIHWWLPWLAALLFLIGLAWLFWRRRWLFVAFALWLSLPLLVIALFAHRAGISFASRRLIFLYPVVILAIAIGVLALARLVGWVWQRLVGQRRELALLGATLLVLLTLGVGARRQLRTYYETPKQDWKTVARILDSYARPSDSVLVWSNAANHLAWYYDGEIEIAEANLSKRAQQLCEGGDSLFVITALTGAPEPQEDRDWLVANLVTVPLKQVDLFYRNCRADAWAGDGALDILEMADRPEINFPKVRYAHQEFRKLVVRFSTNAAEAALAQRELDLIASDPRLAALASPASIAAVSTPVVLPSATVLPNAKAPATTAASQPATAATPMATPSPAGFAQPSATPAEAASTTFIDEALDHYLTQKPGNAAEEARLGAYLARQERLDEAIEHFQAAADQDPAQAETYALWISALQAKGKGSGADQVYALWRAALPNDPGPDRLAERLAGEVSADLGETWEAALEAGREALRAGNWAAAVEAGQQAVAAGPASHESHLLLGDALRASGQLEEALASYVQAAEFAPLYGFLYARQADLLARQPDRIGDALEASLWAIVMDPHRYESWLSLGKTYVAMGAGDPTTDGAAEKALQVAVRLAPATATGPAQALAEFYQSQGQTEAALDLYVGLAQNLPDNTAVQRTYADLQAQAGRFEDALATYQGIIEVDPADRAARMGAAATLVALGRDEEALAEYAAIHELWPEFPWAFLRRGELLEASGDINGALEAFRMAVDLAPDDPNVRFSLAYACRRAGLIEEAVAEFEAGLTLDPTRQAAQAALDELRSGQP